MRQCLQILEHLDGHLKRALSKTGVTRTIDMEFLVSGIETIEHAAARQDNGREGAHSNDRYSSMTTLH